MEGQEEHSWVLLGSAPAAPPLATPAPRAATVGASSQGTVPAPAAATSGRPGKGKDKATLPFAAAPSSSSAAGGSGDAPSARAGSSRAHAKQPATAREPAAAEAAPAIDIGSLSAAQLEELQVRIAQQLQAVSR